MKKSTAAVLMLVLILLIVGVVYLMISLAATTETVPNESATSSAKPTATTASSTTADSETSENTIALFYQTVGSKKSGSGQNSVQAGTSADGLVVDSLGSAVLSWTIGPDGNEGYGDPVFSYLENGNWAMTAWSTKEDPRGAASLMYYEGSCPEVDDEEVKVLVPSTEAGCATVRGTSMAKSSQIFAVGDSNYIFNAMIGSIYLTRLSDGSQGGDELDSLCPLQSPVSTLSDLDYGQSTKVLSSDTAGLLLSDTAIARRADGTWVLFVKGIPPDSGCTNLTLCELCTRAIYRTTSTDLVNWSELEMVEQGVSVPEAVTMPDGTVRLYFQDFSDACQAQDSQLANIAPISTAYELSDSFEMSEAEQVSFPDESFETNKMMHYATNGNPIYLPAEALDALAACSE